jgi:hypothetical protein
MTYRVSWESDAIDELQRIHDKAPDKEAVLNAVTRIGLELASVPLEAGESREQGTRILFKFPLVIWFHANERLREVVIFRVRGWSP